MLKHLISLPLMITFGAYALAIMPYHVRSAFAPMCFIIILSLPCQCPATAPTHPPNPERTLLWADFPSLVKVENKTLEFLLDETLEAFGLSLEIKKAEMAASDLVTRVRDSKLDSREILIDSLSEFEKDARKVSHDLTRFSSRVASAVDNTITVNDYALHYIDAANSQSSGLSIRRLWSSHPSKAVTKQVITQAFTEAMNVLSTNMERLVLEAEVSILDLDKLEKRLNSIHIILTREYSTISTAKHDLRNKLRVMDELCTRMLTIFDVDRDRLGGIYDAGAWLLTKFGVDRGQLGGMEENLALLKGVGGYRNRARAHVVAVLEMLRLMADDMEDLRERVAAPDLVGGSIPVFVHMKSLRIGLERLKGRQAGVKQLREQLEN